MAQVANKKLPCWLITMVRGEGDLLIYMTTLLSFVMIQKCHTEESGLKVCEGPHPTIQIKYVGHSGAAGDCNNFTTARMDMLS